MQPKYLPTSERTIDTQYKERLIQIKRTGVFTRNDKQTEGTYTSLRITPMEFAFANGFPILTERKIGFWRKPINELFAFINGVRDANILAEEWGVSWWRDSWATPEKCGHFNLAPYDMGNGSYGPGFNPLEFVWEDVPNHTDGGRFVPKPFCQFEHLIKQIKKYPYHRTHVVKNWQPHLCLQHEDRQRKVVVAPCHGDIQITILDNDLTLRMTQRSADFPIGIPSNMIQYAALTLVIAHLTGFNPYMFIHTTNDSQIYERHLADVDEIVGRKSSIFPEMYLTAQGEKLTNIFDFRADHFELRNYISEPSMKLDDAVI
jgi:thymidylate synthase